MDSFGYIRVGVRIRPALHAGDVASVGTTLASIILVAACVFQFLETKFDEHDAPYGCMRKG